MANTELRGTLQISIDSQALTATARISRDDESQEITLQHLTAGLKKRGVATGFSEKAIAEQLHNLSIDNSESAEIVIAKGIPPKQQQAETAAFEAKPIPEEHLEHAKRMLQAVGSPELYTEINERVPVEKVVTKKSALPFGQPKKEIVKTTETRTRKEKVYVDPAVQGHGYAYKGEKIGTLFAGEDGVSGWNIYDEEIPAKEHGDPHFYLGNGLERRGIDIIATQDGVIRWGTHWAEMLRFIPHSYTLTLSADKATCLLNFFPGDASVPLPEQEQLRADVRQLEYPEDLLIDMSELSRLMHQAVRAGTPVENVPMSVSRDAAYEITLSEDAMTALLQAHKGRGKGKPLRLKEIGGAIKKAGLAGLDFQKIKEDLLEFYVSRHADMTGYVLAEGTPPGEGPEREVTYSAVFLETNDFKSVQEQLAAHPESTQDLESIEIFPMEAVSEMAPVELEQRVIVLSPPEPGEAGKDVRGKTIPGKPGKPAALELHENLLEKGNIIIASTEGILDKGEIEGVTHLRVRPHKDAEVLVEIAPDGMSAVISMFGSIGSGLPLTEDMVYSAVNEAKVVSGVDQERLSQLIEQARAGGPVQSAVFARGQQPVVGGATKLEFAVHVASGKGVRLRQDGTADYRNQDNITRLHEGELIAVMMPPTISPEDGWEVNGRPIKAQNQNDQQIDIDESIRQEPRDDGTIRLYANIEGELAYEANSLAVRSTHSVKGDISMETGNIRFPGTVQITGSVMTGFYVVAEGDVLIGGAVEGSLVSADGEVKIMQGIKGAKKAVVRSKKGIQTMFAEQGTMLGVEDIQIKNSIMHCRTKTNGSIRLYQDKSTILGGITRARHGIYTSSLGSARGIRTEISFGQDYLIGDRIEQEEKEVANIRKSIAQLDMAMQKRENRQNPTALESLRKKKVIALKAMEKRGLRLFSLRERFEEHFDSEVVVSGTVHPGVIIESHGRTIEVTSERKNITFQFDPKAGHIIEISNHKE